jgi:hypothetical protein
MAREADEEAKWRILAGVVGEESDNVGRIVDDAENEAKGHMLEYSGRRCRRGGGRRNRMTDRERRGRI